MPKNAAGKMQRYFLPLLIFRELCSEKKVFFLTQKWPFFRKIQKWILKILKSEKFPKNFRNFTIFQKSENLDPKNPVFQKSENLNFRIWIPKCE